MGIFCFYFLEIGNYPSMVGHLTTAMLNLIHPQTRKVLNVFLSFCNLPKFNYTARNAQVAASLLQACCLVIITPISGCIRIACSGLMITSLLQVDFQDFLSTILMQVDRQNCLSSNVMHVGSIT